MIEPHRRSVSKLPSRTSWAVFRLLAVLLIAACRDASAPTGTPSSSLPFPWTPNTPTPPPPPKAGPLFISGTMTPQRQGIEVTSGGAPVFDAVVTVNGVSLPRCCGGFYSGSLPEAVPAGGTLNLKVEDRGLSYEASGVVMPTPTITAPVEANAIPWADSVTLAWTTSLDPDRFMVCVNCWENSIFGDAYYTSGSERKFKFAAWTVADFGEGAPVAVYAYKYGFIKSSDSTAEVTSDIQFVARSRDLIITLKR